MRGLPDLTSMAFFIRIVDEGSITAAGRALGLPKATVSRRLAMLEKRIGAPLIARSTRAISLTDAGRRLYERRPRRRSPRWLMLALHPQACCA